MPQNAAAGAVGVILVLSDWHRLVPVARRRAAVTVAAQHPSRGPVARRRLRLLARGDTAGALLLDGVDAASRGARRVPCSGGPRSESRRGPDLQFWPAPGALGGHSWRGAGAPADPRARPGPARFATEKGTDRDRPSDTMLKRSGMVR